MSAGRTMLSVVMPTRNQAAFIAEAVRSVLDQPEVQELVVADGASSDGTPGLLEALAGDYPGRLHWASEPDHGPADAVNRAVARARGHVIGWLNSDDLYTPGAAMRALQAFAADSTLVMVYGEGEHIDEQGGSLGRYPTLGPDAPLTAWADGCPVCQPTAFFRREAFERLGGLDTGLRVAFDYDFWLHVFKAYPGRIGFVPECQALSRLHAAGLTLSQREQVALEAVAVVHRHIGPAPAHWLLTCVDEIIAAHPFHRTPIDLPAHLHALVDRAAPCLRADGPSIVRAHIGAHRALRLASDRFACTVTPDGWMTPVAEVRLWQGPQAVRLIRLDCRHARPRGGRLRLTVLAPDGERMTLDVSRPGPFQLEIPVSDRRADAKLVFEVQTSGGFVPADVDPGSTDRRALAFLVEQAELI